MRPITGVALLLLLLCAQGQAGQDYIVIDLNPPGYTYTEAHGISGGLVAGRCQDPVSGRLHAALWSGDANTFVDIHPSGFLDSWAWGISGRQVVGSTYTTESSNPCGMIWFCDSNTHVSLGRYGGESQCAGTNGTQQVGYARGVDPQANFSAMLWSGDANTYVSLRPDGYFNSYALGISGNLQVGSATPPGFGPSHAIMWAGDANSYVDLHPPGFASSTANGISGTQIVGYGKSLASDLRFHALIWFGDANQFLDLNPSGSKESACYATNGSMQVGYAVPYYPSWPLIPGDHHHAIVWFGDANSYVDLHGFLPAGWWSSEARGIDANGIIVGFGIDPAGNHHALKWVPVPEPFSLCLLAMGLAALRRRRG